jgi:hypothetical protein
MSTSFLILFLFANALQRYPRGTMSFRIEVSKNEQYIIGEIEGLLTREIAQEIVKEYVKIIKSTGITRILNDVRGVQNAMNPIQKYEFAYFDMKNINLPRSIRGAILADVGDITYDFQETVVCNSGYSVKLFHSFEPAIAWLLEDTVD